MTDDTELDDFQSALTELLARRLPVAQTMAVLAGDPAFAAYRDWVRSFEPRLIDTAAMLARVWARRDS